MHVAVVFIFILSTSSSGWADVQSHALSEKLSTEQRPLDSQVLSQEQASFYKTITVSGISSGAHMSSQLLFIYPDMIDAVALVAGGPYYCAAGNPLLAVEVCMKKPESINTDILLYWIEKKNGVELEKLNSKRVFLFHGLSDSVIDWHASVKALEIFTGIDIGLEVSLELVPGMAHTWPTVSYGNECDFNGPPWMGQCNIDFAGQILSKLMGQPLKEKAPMREDSLFMVPVDESYYSFLDPRAFVYYPQACELSSCHLHVVLHGCDMSYYQIGDQFIRHAGMNEWAEANGIIVLYPQVRASLLNTKACWDWFGYTGPHYADHEGSQPAALIQLIAGLKDKISKVRTEKK